MTRYTQRRDARMVSAKRWQKTSGWRRWKRFSLKNSSDTVNSTGHGWIRIKKLREEVVLFVEASGYVAPKLGSSVESSRRQR